MILNKHYEMEQFLEKIVKIFDAQKDGSVKFSCQGQPMDGYSALANYNEISRDIKIFLLHEKLDNHRRIIKIACERSCWCWDVEKELMNLEKERNE